MQDHGHSMVAAGLMSGTSRDGIDAALIETDGEGLATPLVFLSRDYDAATRALIGEACDLAMAMPRPAPHPVIARCEAALTGLHGGLLGDLIHQGGRAIDVLGLHGHTLAHRPELGWTWQIVAAQQLADESGITTVHDLRGADMAMGGQGAPLLPVYHRALFGTTQRDVAVLNLGGVANLTWLGRDGTMSAFDCGMASALIDDWVQRHCGVPFDAAGRIAAAGTVDDATLAAMLDHPFFAAPFPKSLDRADFSLAAVGHLAPADGAATLTAFTAHGVARGLALLPRRIDRLIVTGGGRKNETMMAMIGQAAGTQPLPTEVLGRNGDAIEAEGFAYMAVRRLRGLPNTFPQTTGARLAVVGGNILRPMPRGERAAA